MLANVLILALAASPLVAAHGKVSVVVCYSTPLVYPLPSFSLVTNNLNRLAMQAEIPQLWASKVVLFPAQDQTPRQKSTPQSSTN